MAAAKRPTEEPRTKVKEILPKAFTAPWMTFAEDQCGKKVHEILADNTFIHSFRFALTINSQFRSYETPPELLFQVSEIATRESGKDRVKEHNPEIAKYFEGMMTDPAYDKKKGKSYKADPTFESAGRGYITPWCAAFVHWCLSQPPGVPHLDYATAASWLKFVGIYAQYPRPIADHPNGSSGGSCAAETLGRA